MRMRTALRAGVLSLVAVVALVACSNPSDPSTEAVASVDDASYEYVIRLGPTQKRARRETQLANPSTA